MPLLAGNGDPQFVEKGGDRELVLPPAGGGLCMGSISAKTYGASRWDEKRPHVDPDYGRHG